MTPGIVLMFVVSIELDMLANRKEASGIQRCVAPLAISALIEKLGTDVWCRMVGTKAERPLDLEPIAITPRKAVVLPVKIGTVPVGEQEPAFHRKVEGGNRLHTVGSRSTIGL